MENWIQDILREKKVLIDTLEEQEYFEKINIAGNMMVDCLRAGNKILTAGNGGSAADAQHFTGEVVGRFLREREPLPAITLTVDPTVMTAIANDYGYDEAIARQIDGLGKTGDVVLLISTSGNSGNLINAAREAKKKGMKIIGLLGKNGGNMRELCDVALVVSSVHTPRIQEIHTFSVHLLCEIIENKYFGEGQTNAK